MSSRLASTSVYFLWSGLGLALAWVASYSVPADHVPAAGSANALRHLLHYALHLSPERSARALVTISADGLQPGDVIVASHGGNAYGYFSHVTALISADEVLGDHVGYGIYALPITRVLGYDHVRVLRATISGAQRERVAGFLRRLIGRQFNFLANKHDPRLWNCATSVWAAYHSVGIDLAPERDFIMPDDIAGNGHLQLVREWGER